MPPNQPDSSTEERSRDPAGARQRSGSRWTLTDTFRRHSTPGQSLQPLAVGLGGAGQADFVALTWSDGVYQTELGLEAGRLHRITETQRQLSSCPVLFAWDGQRYAFVSDLLGVGGMGDLISRFVHRDEVFWAETYAVISVADATVTEGGTAEFTISRTGPTDYPVSVTAATSDGTASRWEMLFRKYASSTDCSVRTATISPSGCSRVSMTPSSIP